MDWTHFENSLHDAAFAALASILTEHLEHRFYGFSLQGSYREEDGVMSLPLLSANSNEAFALDHPQGSHDWMGERWNPGDWRWSEVSAFRTPEIIELESQLEAYACSGSVAHWRRTEKRFLTALVSVCRRLRRSLLDDPAISDRLTDDFVVFPVEEGPLGESLLRRCVTPTQFRRLFPALVKDEDSRAKLSSRTLDGQISYHVDALISPRGEVLAEQPDEALRRIGPPAIPALLPLLPHPHIGWNVAVLLGEIGEATPEILEALRDQLRRPARKGKASAADQTHRNCVARALGLLGDASWLVQQLTSGTWGAQSDDLLITGLCHPLRSFRDRALRAPAIDYGPLEAVLKARPELLEQVEEALKPGNGFCTLRPAEVDEAIRGLTLELTVLRAHAACVLGDRALGRAAASRILPALAKALDDREERVRYLALLSLTDWKRQAVPFRDLILRAAQPAPGSRLPFAQIAGDWLAEFCAQPKPT
jgi:hypothetical protein